ncbi:MAG TPA: O-antigen ligase family protein [Hyphomicrobium sp.]|nr:O-antigen ligase family protein [Hyphomicrobium sp.]
MPETLLGQIYTHDLLRQLTGYHHPIGIEQRLGLTRAYGVFDHPIHYGTFCATMAAMFWYAERKTAARFKKAGLLTSATLLGLSSAPLLCLGLQGAMLVWDRLTRGFKARAMITFLVILGLYIGASLVSTRGPIAIIATSMTLDPWTGFYRLQIWENGINNVRMYPITGLGLAEWERPAWMFSSTIDAFWLVIMIRTGVPALLLLVTALFMLIRAVNKRGLKNKNATTRNLARGWTMSLMALSMVATTVHLWNVPFTFFFFFVGTAGWIADPLKVRAKAKKPAATSPQAASSPDPGPRHPAIPAGPNPAYPLHPALPHPVYA